MCERRSVRLCVCVCVHRNVCACVHVGVRACVRVRVRVYVCDTVFARSRALMCLCGLLRASPLFCIHNLNLFCVSPLFLL